MYTEIEKQLNDITDNLETLLIESNAIDEKGNATDVKKFNQILDEKIAQLNQVLATTEKDGVTKDLYGANIGYARINKLEKMKKLHMFNPESAWIEKEDPIEKPTRAEKTRKTSAFNLGIKKLFSIFQSKNRNMNPNENNR